MQTTSDTLQRSLYIASVLAVMLGVGLVLAAGHVDFAWVRPAGLILACVGLGCRIFAIVLRARRSTPKDKA